MKLQSEIGFKQSKEMANEFSKLRKKTNDFKPEEALFS